MIANILQAFSKELQAFLEAQGDDFKNGSIVFQQNENVKWNAMYTTPCIMVSLDKSEPPVPNIGGGTSYFWGFKLKVLNYFINQSIEEDNNYSFTLFELIEKIVTHISLAQWIATYETVDENEVSTTHYYMNDISNDYSFNIILGDIVPFSGIDTESGGQIVGYELSLKTSCLDTSGCTTDISYEEMVESDITYEGIESL